MFHDSLVFTYLLLDGNSSSVYARLERLAHVVITSLSDIVD